VMGDRALGVIDIRPATGEWYDFDAKYAAGGSVHVVLTSSTTTAPVPPGVSS
jgi:D-alanine-D-alanine ligase-like ATP-grasp enzyme